MGAYVTVVNGRKIKKGGQGGGKGSWDTKRANAFRAMEDNETGDVVQVPQECGSTTKHCKKERPRRAYTVWWRSSTLH